jgi:hypothetical protein
VVELRGDEALCVFSSARAALSAAVELQRRFRERINGEPALPLGVGIGLDAGEAVPTEGGYRGRALNVASRLCSLARPGEILASETVRNLAGHQERATYGPRRPTRVKGIAEPVRLVEVVPATELPPVPAPPSAKRRVGKRRLHLRIALVVALAAAIVAVVWARADEAQRVVVAPNSVAVIDPATNEVVDTVPVGDSPGPIAAGAGALWVVNLNDSTLTKINPSAHSAVKSIAVPVPSGRLTPPLLVAAAGQDVWIWACHLTLFRVDPVSIQIVQQLELLRDIGVFPGFTCAVAAEKGLGVGAAWLSACRGGACRSCGRRACRSRGAISRTSGCPQRDGDRPRFGLAGRRQWPGSTSRSRHGTHYRVRAARERSEGDGRRPRCRLVVNEDEGSVTRIDPPRPLSCVRSPSERIRSPSRWIPTRSGSRTAATGRFLASTRKRTRSRRRSTSVTGRWAWRSRAAWFG